jgi:hypothetical protein
LTLVDKKRTGRATLFFMIELSEQQVIEELTDRLANVYATVQLDRVSRIVSEEYARFEGRPIREYIPLFVERNAKAALAGRRSSLPVSRSRLVRWPIPDDCVR